MTNKIIVPLIVFVVLVIGLYALFTVKITERDEIADYRDATYIIENRAVTLVDGISIEELSADSSAKITTRYFGNEADGDINGDGRIDKVFLLTQESGGSGIFYYVVGALGTESGFKGTNGIFIGDRIAPQTTEIRDGEIIVNFAERLSTEPMTAQPSVGVSKYFVVRNGVLEEIPFQQMDDGVIDDGDSPSRPVACTMEAKICPDGSAVGRTGPNCEFSPCPTSPGSSGCFVGGCSGELCTDNYDVASICIWKDEFACYKTAKCERQPNGQCGWTETPSLMQCIANSN